MDDQRKTKDDFTCPICMYIMIQPVTMPCKHSLCMNCYKQCVEMASLSCPVCRLRISVWARKNSRTNTLVDKHMWEIIQKKFPIQLKNQMEGKDSPDDDWDSPSRIETELRKLKDLSEPGEIRQEYEAALAKLEKQREEEARKEEEASAALIQALQEEEEDELTKLAKEREEHERLGRLAAEQLGQIEEHPRLARKGKEVSKRGNEKGSNKNKRCESASLKLESFYNSCRKTSSSAPPFSELATTLTASQESRRNKTGAKSDYSPYPYVCISPCNKQMMVSPNVPHKDDKEKDEVASSRPMTASASGNAIDLTSEDGECNEWFNLLRDDVQQFVKTEPLDSNVVNLALEDPLIESSNSDVDKEMREKSKLFQPIAVSLRTPPKKLPSGEVVDPELIRTIPRSLNFSRFLNQRASSPTPSNCSSETIPDQSQSTNPETSLDYTTINSEFQNKKSAVRGEEESLASASSSPSTTTSVDRLSSQNNSTGYLDKVELTRKIVYGCTKFVKRHAIESSSSYSKTSTATSSSSSSSTSASSSSTSTSASSTSTSASSTSTLASKSSSTISSAPKVTVASSSSPLRCINNNLLADCDKAETLDLNDTIDYFITDDSLLLIPLETGIEPVVVNSNKTNYHSSTFTTTTNEEISPPETNCLGTGKTFSHDHKILTVGSSCDDRNGKQKVKINSSSALRNSCSPTGTIASRSTSIRDWCKASLRKTDISHELPNNDDDSDPLNFLKPTTKKPYSQEEADHLYALQLQKMFSEQEKRNIRVDRFEGSSNEYSFRNKKRRLR